MKKAFEVTLKIGKTLPVFSLPHIEQTILNKVNTCKKFQDYIARLNTPEEGVEVSKLEILGVEMFGERVGFINLRALTTKDGFPMPAYVFLRGPAVAILMIVNDKILLVEQYRVPVQRTLVQAPAGMLDQSGDFVGQAAIQIEEQTGIKLTNDQLHPLGGFYPSPGGSDEELLMFYCEVKIKEEELKVIMEKIHGEEGSKERIKIKLIDFDHGSILATKDAKLIALVFAYENAKQIKNKL